MHSISCILLLCLVVVISGRIPSQEENWETIVCLPCFGVPCEENFKTCKYGTYMNKCNEVDCLKGPGQVCGGDRNKLGVCSDGLDCRCNQCSGLSSITHEEFKNRYCLIERNFKITGATYNDLN